MTKEEIYKASDVLNTILDNYLHGGEAAEVVTKFEDELIKSNLTKEEPTIPDIVDEHFYEMLGEEPVSDDTMTIRKEWFEQCKKSWYNEGYLDGKHNRDSQFGEPVSEDLGEYINELSKQFPEVSFAKLSRIAVRVAKWQKQKDMVIFNELAELANHQDGCYALEAIQMRLNGIINED